MGCLESDDDEDDNSDSEMSVEQSNSGGGGLIDVNSQRMLEMADEFQREQQDKK